MVNLSRFAGVWFFNFDNYPILAILAILCRPPPPLIPINKDFRCKHPKASQWLR